MFGEQPGSATAQAPLGGEATGFAVRLGSSEPWDDRITAGGSMADNPPVPVPLEAAVNMGAAYAVSKGVDPVTVAGLVPGVKDQLAHLTERYRARRYERAGRVLADAAEQRGIEPDELVEDLMSSEDGEELLLAAMRAAEDAAFEAKAKAIAVALADGSIAETVNGLRFETLIERALAQLDAVHIAVLEGFQSTIDAMYQGRAVTSPDLALTRIQLGERYSTIGDGLDPIVAALQREGLLRSLEQSTGIGHQPPNAWQLTDFGIRFLNLMKRVGRMLREGGLIP